MPRLGSTTVKAVSTVVVALLALGVWWLQQGDSGKESSSPSDGASSVAPAPDYAETTGEIRNRPEKRSPTPGSSRPSRDEHGIPYVDAASLPPEAVVTLTLIEQDGPFPYPDKDGSTFGNYEGLLPSRERGYYAEYTVPTPGENDRGARRIIAGDGGERYWTEDHYESFERIR